MLNSKIGIFFVFLAKFVNLVQPFANISISQVEDEQISLVYQIIEEIHAGYVNYTGMVLLVHGDTSYSDGLQESSQSFKSRREIFIDFLLMHFTFSIMLYTNSQPLNELTYYKKPDLYVIVTDEDDFSGIMEFLHGLNNWYPQSKFIVISTGANRTLLIEILATHYVYNVVIIICNNDNGTSTENLDSFSYDPYKYENLNDPELNPIILDVSSIENLYPEKLPLLWRNSSVFVTPVSIKPYVISVPDQIGIDMDITEMLRAKLEVELHYDPILHYDWGWKYSNGTYVSVFRILQLGQTDFVTGHFHFRDPDNLYDFDYTFSYTEDPLIWAVPCPVPISNWSGLIMIFAKTTWYSIIATLFISLAAWQLMGRLTEPGRYYATLYALEVPFLLFLALGTNAEPRKRPMKILYLSSWFFGFICTTSWLSKLTAFLIHETYEEPIKSVQEMFDRGLILGIHPELAEMYGESGDEVGRYIFEHFHECDLSGGCWDQVSYKKDMATITTKRILRYITYDKYMSPKGEQLMIIIEDVNVNMDYTVMFFPKGHPMCSRISQLLMWIREGGFINYFDAHINFKQAITNRREIFNPNQLETKMLGVQQMVAPFALLIIGLIISSVSFLIEISIRIKRGMTRSIQIGH